jgi:hypothetical protein
MTQEHPSPPPVSGFCPRCGERLKLIVKLFDQDKSREMRVYKCQCGELVWDD